MSLNLATHCDLYTKGIQKGIKSLLAVDIGHFSPSKPVEKIDIQTSGLIISVLIIGPIHGEFLFQLNKKKAIELFGIDVVEKEVDQIFKANREDIIEAFKEIVNIATSKSLSELRKSFPNLSITPPRVIEGCLTLADGSLYTSFSATISDIQAFLYIDQAKTDIGAKVELISESLAQERKVQEELIRLNKAKSEFLANMSHELRTPLNGIIGMIDLLKQNEMPSVQRDQIEIIHRSGIFLLSIINDILDFSKIEAGKLLLECRPFNLRKTIEEITDSFSYAIYEKGLRLYLNLDEAMPEMYEGDELRIRQILSNLVGNASKFTRQGWIEIGTKVRDGNLELYVKDTGIGISADKQKLIFEAFTQADASDTRKFGGSGLGLSISNSLAKAMKGKIQVTSEDQVGSTFSLIIPAQNNSAQTTSPNFKFSALSNTQILVHSEFSKDFEILRKYLQQMKIQAQFTQAIFEMKSEDLGKYDVIILDLSKIDAASVNAKIESLSKGFKSSAKLYLYGSPQVLNELGDHLNFKVNGKWNNPIKRNHIENILKFEPNSGERSPNPTEMKKSPVAGKSVLLVEDNQINQLVAASMLKKMNADVTICENGQQALDQIHKAQFDLVLMDCQMPVMDGYEATKNIRNHTNKRIAELPIIALTANASSDSKSECDKVGMNDFLSKPFLQTQLETVLEKVLVDSEKSQKEQAS